MHPSLASPGQRYSVVCLQLWSGQRSAACNCHWLELLGDFLCMLIFPQLLQQSLHKLPVLHNKTQLINPHAAKLNSRLHQEHGKEMSPQVLHAAELYRCHRAREVRQQTSRRCWGARMEILQDVSLSNVCLEILSLCCYASRRHRAKGPLCPEQSMLQMYGYASG